MSYIDGNLLVGERVVFRTRLHWKMLVAPLLFALSTLLDVTWVARAMTPQTAHPQRRD